jgi:hypothetical protein
MVTTPVPTVVSTPPAIVRDVPVILRALPVATFAVTEKLEEVPVSEPRNDPPEMTVLTPVAAVRIEPAPVIVAEVMVSVLLPTLVTERVPAHDRLARVIGAPVCIAKMVVEMGPGPPAPQKHEQLRRSGKEESNAR